MVSRENTVGAVFVVLALVAAYAALQFDAPGWVASAVVLGVGVVCPILVNDFLDRREPGPTE